MLILSTMLVSAEHQHTTNFKLYWKCRKITSPSDKQNKGEAWPSKEVLNLHISGTLKGHKVSTLENHSQKLVQNGMEEKFES